MELVVTGFAGESGSLEIYKIEEIRKKLLDRYPKSFFDVLEEQPPARGTETEEKKLCPGAADMESAGDGGVFGAMWRLLKRNRAGAVFSQRDIPVRQQTIEICEFISADPYRLSSEGCTVWLVGDMHQFLSIHPGAKVIGHVCKGPAIKRVDGGSCAYLRRPRGESS